MICVICQRPGTVTTKALNGLPKDCRAAVQRREVGVSVVDGAVTVTDGRKL